MEENKFYIDNETLLKELDTEDEYFKEDREFLTKIITKNPNVGIIYPMNFINLNTDYTDMFGVVSDPSSDKNPLNCFYEHILKYINPSNNRIAIFGVLNSKEYVSNIPYSKYIVNFTNKVKSVICKSVNSIYENTTENINNNNFLFIDFLNKKAVLFSGKYEYSRSSLINKPTVKIEEFYKILDDGTFAPFTVDDVKEKSDLIFLMKGK
jgi:hypothetical protein